MIGTVMETGLRWGVLIALRPRHIDFLRSSLTVEETIVEVARKDSPTGERMMVKPYPKDNEPRTFAVRQPWLDAIATHIELHRVGGTICCFRRRQAHRSPAIPSAPGSGCRRLPKPVSTSTSGFTTCAMHTPHGCSQGAQTSRA
jgi:integrase